MTKEADTILAEALRLPPEARAALADSLLESIDSAIDEDVELAWRTEIRRRVAELDSGAVQTIEWSEARQRLRAAAGR